MLFLVEEAALNQTEYRLVRSKRKTLAVHVLPDGSVEVRAPHRLSAAVIDAFVSSRQDWINRHCKEALVRQKKQAEYIADEGQTVLWLGKEHVVVLEPDGTARLEQGRVFLPNDENCRRQALTGWYRKEAEQRLLQRMEEISRQVGLPPKKATVGTAKTRWGSCNGKNEIRLSWRLVLLPEVLIDYIIIHELCHTAEHNHSPRFWRRVEQCLPDYAERRQRLRQFETKYSSQLNWL